MNGAPSCGADVVDGQDVRVVQRRRGARLLLEAAEPLGIGGERRREHLDRDLALEPRVARAIDLAHPPRPDRRKDLVRTPLLSDIEGQETSP